MEPQERWMVGNIFPTNGTIKLKENFIFNLINQNYCKGTNYEEKKHFLQQYGMWDSLYTDNTILGTVPDFANTEWRQRVHPLHRWRTSLWGERARHRQHVGRDSWLSQHYLQSTVKVKGSITPFIPKETYCTPFMCTLRACFVWSTHVTYTVTGRRKKNCIQSTTAKREKEFSTYCKLYKFTNICIFDNGKLYKLMNIQHSRKYSLISIPIYV